MRVYQTTNVGLVRRINEDAVLCFDPYTYLVADGMGGHAAGEVASRILVDTIRQTLTVQPAPWGENELSQAVLRANEAILKRVSEAPELRGMGTTATLLHFEGNTAYYAHVGDSRLYLIRGGYMMQITRDHSYVEELVAMGSITHEEARNHPRKNLLTRAVGVMEKLSVDSGSFGIEQGDRLLLCTDGLTNMVSDNDIMELLKGEGNPADALISKAMEAGGSDNITAIVVVYDHEE